jgi:sulfur-oxidizing protein SoxY
MIVTRRLVLQSALAGAAVYLTARGARAAQPRDAFAAKTLDEALQNLFAGARIEASEAVTLKAPDIAENGAIVPVTVVAELPEVESISLLVEHNPVPLIASFALAPAVYPEVSTRIKMAETSQVVAVAKAGGKLYAARKEVTVTVGGCVG